MKLKAYGKVNITLDVVGKREDGYHLLEMIMQTVDLYDVISIDRAKEGINLSCNKAYIPTDERNLAYKAARLFMETYNVKSGVKIGIEKNIPVAAGMAGGSCNAAAVLKGLNEFFEINAPIEALRELGLKIGADVPYCIEGGTALCKGIGEDITPLKPFKNHIIVLVKPSFGVSTKEVYGAIDINKINKHPETNKIIEAMERNDLRFVSCGMKNVLENVTIRKHRILRGIKEEMILNGAMGALMSGSGPTIFAFFEDMVKAQKCYDRMKQKYKEVYITRTI